MKDNGILYLGSKGAILGGGWADSPRIIPESAMRAYQQPPQTLPRVKSHHRNWLDACKGLGEPSTPFDYGGPLTEFCLMGNVALQANTKLEFDWKKMRITNHPEANKLLKPNYREGWTI
jgi:hypothetical protein